MVKKSGVGIVNRIKSSHKIKESKININSSKIEPKSEAIKEKKLAPKPILEEKSFEKNILGVNHFIPKGIKLFLWYMGLLGFFYIFFGALFPLTILFGIPIEGFLARAINIIMLLFIFAIFFGYLTRKKVAYHFASIFFLFSIINALFSVFFIKSFAKGIIGVFVMVSFAFILLMNAITLWYVHVSKDYLYEDNFSKTYLPKDKIYSISLSALWIIFIIISIIASVSFYYTTIKKVDVYTSELSAYIPVEAIYYCEVQDDDKDICLLTSAILFSSGGDTSFLCKHIDSGFYKYICYKEVSGGV